jgi:hypothetical protein
MAFQSLQHRTDLHDQDSKIHRTRPRARDQFAELVPVFERVLGKEHPDSLAARASLAHWIKEAASAPSPGAN